MSTKQQRDFIIEGEDTIIIGNDAALQALVDRLPARPLLTVSDIAIALDVSGSLVYAWIDSGQFRILNAHGGDKAFYKIFRESFITFLKGRIV